MDLQQQADLFRAQDPFDEVPTEWNLLKGMKCPKANVPIFTHLNDTRTKCLGETSIFRLYLNVMAPYPELYPEDPARAGMAFGHFLAVPKERIYNAATLKKGDAFMIRHMRYQVRMWMNSDVFRYHVAHEMTKQYIPHLTTKELREDFAKRLDRFVHHTTGDNFEFYFHVHPNHTVGHLHMHCITDDKTEAFGLIGDKNVPVDEVLKKYCAEE